MKITVIGSSDTPYIHIARCWICERCAGFNEPDWGVRCPCVLASRPDVQSEVVRRHAMAVARAQARTLHTRQEAA